MFKSITVQVIPPERYSQSAGDYHQQFSLNAEGVISADNSDTIPKEINAHNNTKREFQYIGANVPR